MAMNVEAILAIIEKTVKVSNALIQAEQSAEPAIRALISFARGVKDAPRQADIEKTDARLDKLIADFNLDI